MDDIENIENRDSYKNAVKLLARRDYSKQKLVQKLKDKGASKQDAEEVIEHLREKSWFKEEYYTEGRIKYFIRKGHSLDSISMKLSEEEINVSNSLIQEWFDELKTSETDQIKELILKKLVNPIELPEKLPDRVIRYILSRGHSFPEILSVFSQMRTTFNS